MEAAINGTAEAWRERIAGQRGSGQSIRAWCRDNNHHEHAFYWWRSRLGLSPKSAVKRDGRRVGRLKFAEVVVAQSLAEPPAASFVEPICLRLGGGRELILPPSMPVAQLAQLVRAIEGAA